jgi:putative transposase
MLPVKHSNDGAKTGKSKFIKLKVDTEDTKLTKTKMITGTVTSMLESQVLNKKKIFKGKLNYFKNGFPTTKLLQTLVQQSILKEKDLKPFYGTCSTEMSKKLWLPTKTDGQDSVSKCLNGSFNYMAHNSWSWKPNIKHLNKNSQKILCQSPQFLQPDITVPENISYSRKIRIYPTKEQKLLFNKCFGAHRYFYNKTVDYIENNDNVKYSLASIRPKIMKSDKDLVVSVNKEIWQKNVPYDTRQLAINEAIQSYKTSFTLLKKKINKFFKIKFKSKKDNRQIFNVDKRAININLRLFKRRLKKPLKANKRFKRKFKNKYFKIKNKKSLSGTAPHNCIIIRENPGKYYICVPLDKKQITDVKQPNNLVALDPGVRTFQTFYSSDEVIGKLGNGTADKKIKPLSKKVDKLISIKNSNKKNSGRRKRNIKNRCHKLRTKMKNIVNDLHWKTASYLCKTFSNILIPIFQVSKMVSKYGIRNINKETVKDMLSLSHYRFRQRLLYKASCYNNVNVYVCKEDYTSKTCTNCGNIKSNLGGNKRYNCNNCGISIDRDVSGARNILLKF